MKKLIKIGLAVYLMVTFSGCNNVSSEKKDFFYKVDGLYMNLEYQIGIKAQFDGSGDTKELSKTISYHDKVYSVEYDKNKIIIKDFSEKDLCNQGLEYYLKEDKSNSLKKYRNILIDCKTKDAIVTVTDEFK